MSWPMSSIGLSSRSSSPYTNGIISLATAVGIVCCFTVTTSVLDSRQPPTGAAKKISTSDDDEELAHVRKVVGKFGTEGKSLIRSVESYRVHRPYMEDRHKVTKNAHFAAVYDGHGGLHVSQYLRDNLYRMFLSHLSVAVSEAARRKGVTLSVDDTAHWAMGAEQEISTLLPSVLEPPAPISMHAEPAGHGPCSSPVTAATGSPFFPAFSRDSHRRQQRAEDVVDDIDDDDEEEEGALQTSPENGELGHVTLSPPHASLLPKRLQPTLAGLSSHFTHAEIVSFVRHAFESAFSQAETEVVRVKSWEQQGSTAACAALVYGKQGACLVTANVGDSRVVLSRAGNAVNLTKDHKPNDPFEEARIKELGGRVAWHGFHDGNGDPIDETGVYRVNRNLAVARAIGDATEKPYISAVPDIKEYPLEREHDQFLIIATDGLWDVMSSDEAVDYVHTILSDPIGALREASSSWGSVQNRPSERRLTEWTAMHPTSDRKMIQDAFNRRKRSMARYLCEEAIRRGTSDNISVIVVWLQ